MSQKINELLLLEEKINNENRSHLMQKANLSKELKQFEQNEEELRQKLVSIKSLELSLPIPDRNINLHDLEIYQEKLTSKKMLIEQEIVTIQNNIGKIKTEISLYSSDISAMIEIKKNKENEVLLARQKQAKNKRVNIKIKNMKEKLRKLELQYNQQLETKNNLLAFAKAFETIQNVLKDYDNLSKEISEANPEDFSDSMKNQIISSRNLFSEALKKFSSNDIIPFLTNAQKSYQLIIETFIQLCELIPSDILNEDFSTQVFKLMDYGLPVNTRHLSAVESMLRKMEKGVEIAPLASFANEVREYFIENLTLFRITGWDASEV